MTIKQKIATLSSVASILLLISSIGVERKTSSFEEIFAAENSAIVMVEETMKEDVLTKGETTLSKTNDSAGTMSAQTTTKGNTQNTPEPEKHHVSTDTEVLKTAVSTITTTTTTQASTTKATTTHAATTQVSTTVATTTYASSTQATTNAKVVTTTAATTVAEMQEVEEATTTTFMDDSIYEPEGGWISLQDLSISQDMDISKPTGLSREDFVTLMNNLKYDYTGYYNRNAELIWQLCQENGMNEIFACGIIAQESGWARIAGWGQNNYFGIAGGRYATEEEGLTRFIQLVGNQYLKETGRYYKGKTMHDVGLTYCDGTNWPTAVYGCMNMILRCK